MTDTTLQTRIAGLWRELGGPAPLADRLAVTGSGDLASCFPVSDLAAASVGTAGLALAELLAALGASAPAVTVDRRLASLWFSTTIAPVGWQLPPLWDPIAGDYAARDGFIRLHTNAPHHKKAAQSVLGPHETREAMAAAVAGWDKTALESAVVEAGGCAAEMRSVQAWRSHPAGMAVADEPLAAITLSDGRAGAWEARPDRPLAGLKVLDLTRVLAGPVATRVLAGYGADVLRLDPPWWDEPGVVPEMTLGKRCARLDLTAAAGRETFLRLLAQADIFVSGYRSDALAALGLGAQDRARIRPGLVDITLDAYGWTGPWATRRGFDSLVQMSSGIAQAGMAWKGADKPVPLPVQALDHAAGYFLAAMALRGLAQRASGGGGLAARLSLARTGLVLTGWGQQDGQPPFAPLGDGDYSPVPEATEWGPARRLRPPLDVAGVPLAWDIPARALGRDEARWPA